MKEINVDDFLESHQVKMKDFKVFSDNDTYALRDLKKASQKNLFWSYLDSIGFKDNRTKVYIYYYFYGTNKTIYNTHVFTCRESVQPSRWFYNISEKLPERINFTPKFTAEKLQYKESVGHKKLTELREQYTYNGIADRFNINYNQLKNTFSKRINPLTKEECFKILPQQSMIIKLKDVINPDYWFIFPEEL